MTSTDLLSAVLADPFDDAPRLILADWLEENDDPERAEFIRDNIQQCDRCSPHLYDSGNTYGIGYHPERDPASGRHEGGWTNCKSCNGGGSGGVRKRFTDHDNEILKKVVYIVRRGFPDEICCTMDQWVGGSCRLCEGDGEHPPRSFGYARVGNCNVCHGAGRTPGIAKQVCEAWPVARVVLTDRMPTCSTSGGSRWRLDIGLAQLDSGIFIGPYRSKAEAERVVSHAAVNYGRRLAGLKPLDTTR